MVGGFFVVYYDCLIFTSSFYDERFIVQHLIVSHFFVHHVVLFWLQCSKLGIVSVSKCFSIFMTLNVDLIHECF